MNGLFCIGNLLEVGKIFIYIYINIYIFVLWILTPDKPK